MKQMIGWRCMMFLVIVGLFSDHSSFLLVDGRTNKASRKFLKEKREEAGVIELDSGLMYKVKYAGSGNFHPSLDSTCNVDFDIFLKDGTKIESTFDGLARLQHDDSNDDNSDENGGAKFKPKDSFVFPALREAMQLMVVGDWWELYVPSELAYGNEGTDRAPRGDAIVVSLTLNQILMVDDDDNHHDTGGRGDLIPKGERHRCLVHFDEMTHFRIGTEFCNKRDLEYIQKVERWLEKDQRQNELDRLRNILQKGALKENLAKWARRRIHIIKQFPTVSYDDCRVKRKKKKGVGFKHEKCNYKEQEYTFEVHMWEPHQIAAEITRIKATPHADMEDDQDAAWLRRQLNILHQFLPKDYNWDEAATHETTEPETSSTQQDEVQDKGEATTTSTSTNPVLEEEEAFERKAETDPSQDHDEL